jgi:hypothetical protein
MEDAVREQECVEACEGIKDPRNFIRMLKKFWSMRHLNHLHRDWFVKHTLQNKLSKVIKGAKYEDTQVFKREKGIKEFCLTKDNNEKEYKLLGELVEELDYVMPREGEGMFLNVNIQDENIFILLTTEKKV